MVGGSGMLDESGEVEMNWTVVPVPMSGETGQTTAKTGSCHQYPRRASLENVK